MKVLILGGDGYLGWPTAMHLSKKGFDVAVADNYLRRQICHNENIEPLFSVPNLHQRADTWHSITNKQIKIFVGDLTQWDFVEGIFKTYLPDAIVHYAEQPSAPYSMMNRRAATLTLQNNLMVTSNLIFAVKEFCPETHIVKLGTMGEYGTPNIDIEEGWIEIEHKNRKDNFLYPRQASSLYHTTKIMDTDLLWFYVRMWGLRVTDLMQGPVYGLFTEETSDNPDLLSYFNYDEIFGTVVNRFIVQAVAGYPLTVFGKGGQTRGYLNLIDTINCVRLSLENPANEGTLRIFNQITETFSVKDLAQMVKKVGDGLGLNVQIKPIKNPRKEAEEHYYNPTYTGLLDLGLKPHYLSEKVIERMMSFVLKHKNAINREQIFKNITWE